MDFIERKIIFCMGILCDSVVFSISNLREVFPKFQQSLCRMAGMSMADTGMKL